MGISGLLPIVAPKLVKRHISSYKHQRIGIDGHAWLYQILSFVSEEIFFKVPTKKHIAMFEEKVRVLENYGITPVVVLDGDTLPSKEETNRKRQVKKERNRKEAEHWLMKNDPEKAKGFMRQCITVTREIVSDIAKMLERINVEYIISPYESDAQLCYLQRVGYIDCILTEDSDLIPYGSNRILYKFDCAFVQEFTRDCLTEARGKDFEENILDISILSGCDYLASIQGIGVVTAHKLLSREKTVEGVIEYLRHRKPVPSGYLDDFLKAKKTFLHQVVYDPIQQKRRYLRDLREKLDFLGTLKEEEYRVEDGPLESFFKAPRKIRAIKRHFIPAIKKRRSEASEIKRGKKERHEARVDIHIHSPYFN
ncbi:flap endonuclease-1 H3TH domain-containing protein [Encephalitozoon hellem]|nr:flap endonuclease-1 H3TH domain-containing protein [Encephalitozoon hellem]